MNREFLDRVDDTRKTIAIYGPAGSGKDWVAEKTAAVFNMLYVMAQFKDVDESVSFDDVFRCVLPVKRGTPAANGHPSEYLVDATDGVFTPKYAGVSGIFKIKDIGEYNLPESVEKVYWGMSNTFGAFRLARLIAFADPVKHQLASIIGCHPKYFYDRRTKEECYYSYGNGRLYWFTDKPHFEPDPQFEVRPVKDFEEFFCIKSPGFNMKARFADNSIMSFRELMVAHGTYVMQEAYGENVWVKWVFDHLKASNDSDTLNIITDIRFPREYRACGARGIPVIRIVNEHRLDGERDVDNIAESHYSEFAPDFTFVNNPSNPKVTMNSMYRLFDEVILK
jgi:hypothetical protein